MSMANFFLVGAQKAGTSSVEAVLKNHSQVYLSPIKEPNHFCSDIHDSLGFRQPDDAINLNLRSYLSKANKDPVNMYFVFSRSDYDELFKGANGAQVIGECSTTYLPSVDAARHIHSYNEKAKILICLRNPVDRMLSHYAMNVRTGLESRTLHEAIDAELAGNYLPWSKSGSYIRQSLYRESVERYIKVFGRSNVCVIFFEDFVANPIHDLNRISSFLGISEFPQTTTAPRVNEANSPRFPGLNAFMQESGIKTALRSYLPKQARKIGKRLLFKNGRHRSDDSLPPAAVDLLFADARGLLSAGIDVPKAWRL